MESEIRFNVANEIRNEPKNLASKDMNLFAHEFKFNLPKVFKIELDNINVLRDTIFSGREFKFYKSLTHIFYTPNKYFWKRLRLLLTFAQHQKQGIWITDEISAEYFHWFTDALSRLIAIESTYDSKEMLQKNFSVILPEFYRNKPYIEHSLREMGYTPFYFNPKKRLKVQKLISATHTAPTGNYNSLLISKVHDSLRLENERSANRKIYISRAKATKRTVLNEMKVIQLLKSYGYEIHSFEDYSFQKQLEIMSDT
jgi:capsular polysaccharide biosynthesis protein